MRIGRLVVDNDVASLRRLPRELRVVELSLPPRARKKERKKERVRGERGPRAAQGAREKRERDSAVLVREYRNY
jgi:hypothetical protein